MEESASLLFLPPSVQSYEIPSKDVRWAINHHAQSVAARRRKREQVARVRRHRTLQPNVSREPPRRVGEATEAVDITSEQPAVTETSLTRYVPSKSERNTAISPQSYLDTAKLDPFSEKDTLITPQMHSVYTYYFNTIMPTVEPIAAERDEYNSWLVPLTLREPALLYALVGCMAYDIDESSANGFGPTKQRNMLSVRTQYKIEAIRALNRCLVNPDTALLPSTLVAVHFLLWQEMFTAEGDIVHLDGIKRLLELRGGFGGIQRKAIEAIMVGNTWRAIRTRTRPSLPMVKDDLVMTAERFDDILSHTDSSVAKTGSLLIRPQMRCHFSPAFWQLLQDTRVVWVCFEQIGVYPFPALEKRHISIKRVNIDHRLLSYPFDHPDDEPSPIQEAIRIAIILYSSAHYNVIQPSSAVGRALITDLKAALEQTDLRGCWGDARDALLWALFLGAHLSAGQPERPWFVTALSKARLGGQARNWMAARRLLVGFYYSDRVFLDSLRKTWDEVEGVTELLLLYQV